MTLNSTQLEQLRLSLLRFLDATPQDATAEGLLFQYVRNEGRSGLQPGTVTAELIYLKDLNFVALAEKPLSPENRAWRITAQGRNFYAQQT